MNITTTRTTVLTPPQVCGLLLVVGACHSAFDFWNVSLRRRDHVAPRGEQSSAAPRCGNVVFAPFYGNNRTFTKTGSGQPNTGKVEKDSFL
jgi:hypothetical protein